MIESLKFVQMVEDATLESESQLSPEDINRLRNPQAHLSTPSDDPDLLLSVSCFVDLLNSSQDAYDKVCRNIRRRSPEIEMLSYDRVKRKVQNLSGIITLKHDICINTLHRTFRRSRNLSSLPRASLRPGQTREIWGDAQGSSEDIHNFPCWCANPGSLEAPGDSQEDALQTEPDQRRWGWRLR